MNDITNNETARKAPWVPVETILNAAQAAQSAPTSTPATEEVEAEVIQTPSDVGEETVETVRPTVH